MATSKQADERDDVIKIQESRKSSRNARGHGASYLDIMKEVVEESEQEVQDIEDSMTRSKERSRLIQLLRWRYRYVSDSNNQGSQSLR